MALERVRDRYGLLATLVAGWAAIAALSTDTTRHLFDRLDDTVRDTFGGWIVWHIHRQWLDVGTLALVAATLSAVVIGVVRVIARARLRATGVDPLEGLRRWTAEKPGAVRVLLFAPALLAFDLEAVLETFLDTPDRLKMAPWLVPTMGLPALGIVLLTRALLRTVRAPLVEETERERRADGFLFSAVAVTREARAAVASFAAVTLAVVAALVLVPTVASDPRVPSALLAYASFAAAGAFAFRRASRVALGFDGVRIGGTSRTRFFAYRDLDAVETTRSGDILLRRHGRMVLRLQLHGEDASLRDAIVDRLRSSIAAAGSSVSGAAHRLAEAASPALLAQAARGDGNYRAPGATREELWELVEMPSAGSRERALAASALVKDGSRADRARLRIAAERCADPETRAALEQLSATEAEAEEEAAAALRLESQPPGRA